MLKTNYIIPSWQAYFNQNPPNMKVMLTSHTQSIFSSCTSEDQKNLTNSSHMAPWLHLTMNQGLPALSLGVRYKFIKVLKVLLQQWIVTWANRDGFEPPKNFKRNGNMIYWQKNWTWQSMESVWPILLWWLSVSSHTTVFIRTYRNCSSKGSN